MESNHTISCRSRLDPTITVLFTKRRRRASSDQDADKRIYRYAKGMELRTRPNESEAKPKELPLNPIGKELNVAAHLNPCLAG